MVTETFLAFKTQSQMDTTCTIRLYHRLQGHHYKVFYTENLHLLSGLQPYKSSKQTLYKPYICIIEGEKKLFQNQTISVLVLAIKKVF